jgi:Fis family transcriptional regulator, factor for inversion stimulation protein
MIENANFLVNTDEDVKPLGEYIHKAVEHYFSRLEGEDPFELYNLVLKEVEAPLLKIVMKYVKGNQSKASELLGLSRGTVRKKLKQFEMLKEGKNK